MATAKNSRGHGMHSPFVFDFIKNVLQDKNKYNCYEQIEGVRNKLLRNKEFIEVEDFGARASKIKSSYRRIKDIAAHSLKQAKYGKLLYRIVNYYRPKNIVELGTSLGITTAYLANGNPYGAVYTCEGASAVAAIADENFDVLELKNIKLLQGDFAATLPRLCSKLPTIGLGFIDGNHRKEPTLQYFQQLLKLATPSTVIIFDDIHWSSEMEEAWRQIKQHPDVTLSIDLFFIGLVFFNPGFKVKQHFTIRF